MHRVKPPLVVVTAVCSTQVLSFFPDSRVDDVGKAHPAHPATFIIEIFLTLQLISPEARTLFTFYSNFILIIYLLIRNGRASW